MSDEIKPGEGQETKGEGPKVNVDEVLKRLEQLEGSYNRVLEESKQHKSKSQEYRNQLEELEKRKVEESGDVAKQLEYEKKNREKVEAEAKELKNSVLSQKVREVVGKYAKDVHDLDDFLNQPKFSHILKSGIDRDKLSVDEDAAKDYVNKVLEAKPWLKKHTQSAGVDNSKPRVGSVSGSKDYKSMSSKEIMEDILKTGKL